MSFWTRSLRAAQFWTDDEPEQPATEQPPREQNPGPPTSALRPIGEAAGGFSKFKQITERPPEPTMSAFSRLSAMMTFQKPAERPEVAAANKERTRELERLKAFKREGEDQLVSRYLTLLSRRTLDLVELRREVADNFVPDSVRDLVWKLLCGYMPADAASRDTFINLLTEILAEQAREAYVHTRDELYAVIPASDELPDPLGDRKLLNQIRVDIPRTSPIDGVTYFKHVNWLFGQPHIQQAMEHVCYVWSKEHADTGYFQGFSDLVVPFFVVFSVTFASPDGLMALSTGRARKAEQLSQLDWDSLEADTYWCLCRMLRMLPADPNNPPVPPPTRTMKTNSTPCSSASSSADLPPSSASPLSPSSPASTLIPAAVTSRPAIQTALDDLAAGLLADEAAIHAVRSEDWMALHRGLALRCLWGIPGLSAVRGVLPTASHPGINAMIKTVREVVAFYDAELFKHLEMHRVDYMFFCMRWFICLMTRELPLCALLQLWDQYLTSDNLYLTHVYICAAMLITFRTQLLELGFGEMLMLLQNLPSQLWDAEENQLFDPAYHLRKVFKLAGIIYQEHVRSKDAFIAAYLIMFASIRGHMSLSAYLQATTFLFVIQKLETASRAPVVIIEEDG